MIAHAALFALCAAFIACVLAAANIAASLPSLLIAVTP
jgi:hypothetical protein